MSSKVLKELAFQDLFATETTKNSRRYILTSGNNYLMGLKIPDITV